MKIVVIGGTGLIGSKTVPILRQGGHEVVAASPNIVEGCCDDTPARGPREPCGPARGGTGDSAERRAGAPREAPLRAGASPNGF